MKKLLFTLSIIFAVTFTAFSQSTAITPGSVLPNMTTAQRTALAAPVNGMLVFDNTTQSYWFRKSGAWVELPKAGSTSNYWQLNGLNGNEIKNTNSGGFWSGNPVTVQTPSPSSKTVPVNGDGTRLMWIPVMSAFRVGTVTNGSKAWDKDSVGFFSMALGVNNRASGGNSFATGVQTNAKGFISTAMGSSTSATGTASTAMGSNTSATGLVSTALGSNSEATGDYSTAMGYFTNANGNFSTAIGGETEAIGNYSTATGLFTDASGLASTAMGRSTDASGLASTAMGRSTVASGDYSTSMGDNTIASGFWSTAMGRFTITKAVGCVSIGLYNDASDSPQGNFASSTDRLFQIGNGGASTRSNALTVLRNGYIGTRDVLNPQAPIHIKYDGFNDWDGQMRLEAPDGNHANILYSDDGLKFRTFRSGDGYFFRNSNNDFIATIYSTGNMTITGTLTQDSDRRLKNNIVGITNSSNKINQLNGYNYHWKAEDRDPNLQTGLIAQEVQALFPELVSEDENGYLSVNYTGLIPHLIEAVKDLQTENTKLNTQLTTKDEKYMHLFAELKTEMNALKSAEMPTEITPKADK